MVQLRFSILALLILMGCANRGNPTGGEIDTEPPIVIKSSPENFTTNFEAEEIEIIFNEYFLEYFFTKVKFIFVILFSK